VMMAFITAVMVVGLMSVSTASKADDASGMEKCFGVVKAGMNDCDNNDISCSMKAVIDSDPNYWIYVPKGTCAKLVGGITKQSASSGMGTTGGMGSATGASMSTGSGMGSGSGMDSGSSMSPGTSMGTDPGMGSSSTIKPATTTPPTSMKETKTKVR
jgi:uncharacterized membrane protein